MELTRRPRSAGRGSLAATAAALLVASLPLLASGCTWTRARPVAYSDRDTTGVRVYDPKPLLIITEKSTNLVFVPDFRRGYAMQYGSLLARNETTISMDEGRVTRLHSVHNTAELLSLIKTWGQEAIEQADKLAALGAVSGGIPGMEGIYELVISEEGEITALRPITGTSQVLPPRDATTAP